MLEGIVIGGAGGIIAGLVILILQWLTEKVTERADKKEILKKLSDIIEQLENYYVGPETRGYGVSTIELAYFTSLPTERVQYICKKYKEFVPNKKMYFPHKNPFGERWGIEKF
jgi:hypothetical protein